MLRQSIQKEIRIFGVNGAGFVKQLRKTQIRISLIMMMGLLNLYQNNGQRNHETD